MVGNSSARVGGNGPDFSFDTPEGASWAKNHKGGPNSFFIILLSTTWWSVPVQDENSGIQNDWFDAYENVNWVFDSIVGAH